MQRRASAGFRVLETAVYAYARIDHAVSALGNGARLFTDGALGQALDAGEQTRLTIGLYDRAARPYHPDRGLWTWEEAWYARRLPPPPARVLIGGAGAGREAIALADRGYQVAAFEPAPTMCAAAATLARGRFPVVRADYDDLADAVLGRGPLAGLVAGRWDAILFGWTSLSHVLDPDHGARALAAAARLAPHGPILVSYVARLGASGRPNSRLWRLGRRLGSAAARARGRAAADDGVQFDRAIGFVRPYAPDEIDAMAAAIDRRAIHEPDAGFPHATLVAR